MNILFATYQAPPSQAQDSIGYLYKEDSGTTTVYATDEPNVRILDLLLLHGFVRLDSYKDDGTPSVYWRED